MDGYGRDNSDRQQRKHQFGASSTAESMRGQARCCVWSGGWENVCGCNSGLLSAAVVGLLQIASVVRTRMLILLLDAQ